MNQLQEEIRRVQSERDEMDHRLAALEIEKASNGSRDGHSDAATLETPQLRVVRLRPEGADDGTRASDTAAAPEEGAATDEPAARPTVHVAGGKAPKRKSGSEAIVDGDAPAATPAPAGISAMDPEAKRTYDGALALVQARRFDEALDAFAGFLVKWPDHPNADNAFYWRGECYFAKGLYAKAAEQFEATVRRFPYGNKVPDALLKLGMSQEKLGATAAARAAYDRLSRDYPRSEAARRVPRGAHP